MKLHPIINTVAPDAAFHLGMVMAAHNNRAFCRAHCTAAMAAKVEARKDLSDFGGYADCGPSYEASHAEAQGRSNEAIRAKISAEKFYRKMKLDFIAAYPQYVTVLATMIPGSTQDLSINPPKAV